MPRTTPSSTIQEIPSPDYLGLVRFLLEPFLEESESLHIDCEYLVNSNRIWLRVAFDTADKGKVFGRGGRNIKAVETILETAAINANQSLYLDVYNADSPTVTKSSPPRKNAPRRPEKAKNRVIL